MQKIIIIAILCATAYSATFSTATPGSLCAGTTAGFVIQAGVCQKCHASCKTCKNTTSSGCLTCHGAAVNDIQLTSGVCACTTAGEVLGATAGAAGANGVPKCGAAATASVALCKGVPGMWYNTDKCDYCGANCRECSNASTCLQDAAAVANTSPEIKGCWGGVANGAAQACTYAAATANIGTDDVVNQSAATTSAVKGYFYNATGHIMTACGEGCESCTNATTGCVCASGFQKVSAGNACECPADGYLTVVSDGATLGSCTACETGCKTCTAAKVCSTCMDSYSLGSTTDSSSTCFAVATTTDTSATASTTDGEKDGESTSATATDATSTNGVLLTAASMLLAVILA